MSIRDELKNELLSRGFRADLTSPNGTMVLSETFFDNIHVLDFLDMMITRREKVFRSVDVVGHDAAKKSYDDVILVIDAIKTVLTRLLP